MSADIIKITPKKLVRALMAATPDAQIRLLKSLPPVITDMRDLVADRELRFTQWLGKTISSEDTKPELKHTAEQTLALLQTLNPALSILFNDDNAVSSIAPTTPTFRAPSLTVSIPRTAGQAPIEAIERELLRANYNNNTLVGITPETLVNALIAAPYDEHKTQLLQAFYPILADFHDLAADPKLHFFHWLNDAIADANTSPMLKAEATKMHGAIQVLKPELQALSNSDSTAPIVTATTGFRAASLPLCIPKKDATQALDDPYNPRLPLYAKSAPIKAITKQFLQLA